MSNELVTLDPTGNRLQSWAGAMVAAAELGSALARTAFAPAAFRGKPEECAAAIMYGDEVGLTPMQSLQAIFVISGKPGLYARSMVAIVLAAGHDVETVEKTDTKVSVRGRRKGSEEWVKETWTTERARRAGYVSNKKYETDPQSMLYARAAADICRQIAPDALAGLTLTVEEIELEEAAPTTKITRKTATAVTMKREEPAQLEPAFDEPETPAVEVDTETGELTEPKAEETTPSAQMITGPQTRMMGAQMKELKLTSRDDALAYCADVIGRAIESRNDLTKTEAGKVIDSLTKDTQAQTPDTETFPNEPTFDEETGN